MLSQRYATASRPQKQFLNLISVRPETLVTGVDRWHLERLLDFDFIWYSMPFEHSRSQGFIIPGKEFSVKLPLVLAVDLSEAQETDLLSFDQKNTVFYSEEWNLTASSAASFVRNIVNFSNGKWDVVKKDHRIVPFGQL